MKVSNWLICQYKEIPKTIVLISLNIILKNILSVSLTLPAIHLAATIPSVLNEMVIVGFHKKAR